MLVYDIGNKDSFDDIINWIQAIKEVSNDIII